MARIRTIKPDFFTSLTVADLSLEQRLTFIGLWTHCDDAGRCVDDARLVKAAIWPLDDRTSADVEGDVRALADAGLIVRYVVDGRHFMAVTGWSEHQRINRPTPSKCPPPEEGETPAPPPTRLDDEAPAPETPRKQAPPSRDERGAPPAPIDEDGFALTDAMRRWALETFGEALDVDFETQQFVDHHRAQATRRSNWPAAWQKWVRQSVKWKSESARPPLRAVSGGSYQPYQNPADTSVYENGF